MPYMVSDRPMRIAYNGADATFEAGVPRFVRESLLDTALQFGVALADGPTPKTETPDTFSDEQIQAAIQSLLDDGQIKSFGADGKPRVRVIEKVLGGNIDAADRDRVWEGMNNG